MGTPLATAIACCMAERERGIWMTRYMKEWRNIKLYQFSGPFWNVAWILFDHLHHTDLHCIVTPRGSKLRFSDTTSPMVGKNMSCLTFCEKKVCVYLRPSHISLAWLALKSIECCDDSYAHTQDVARKQIRRALEVPVFTTLEIFRNFSVQSEYHWNIGHRDVRMQHLTSAIIFIHHSFSAFWWMQAGPKRIRPTTREELRQGKFDANGSFTHQREALAFGQVETWRFARRACSG